MFVLFQCGSCGRKLKAAEALTRKLARCPSCGGKTRVPAAPSPKSAPKPAAKPTPAVAGKKAGKNVPLTGVQPTQRKTTHQKPPASADAKKTMSPRVPTAAPSSSRPGHLLALAFLPLGLGPIAFFLGGNELVWTAVGIGLAASAVGLFVLAKMASLFRNLGITILAVGGYLAFFVLFGGGPELKWLNFVSPDKSFSCDFPGPPVASTNPIGGLDSLRQQYVVELGGIRFEINHADFAEGPESPEVVLDQAQERLVSQGGKLARKEDIVVKYPGRDVDLETPRGRRQVRLFLIERRLYQLEVSGRFAPSHVAHFFQSFTVLHASP